MNRLQELKEIATNQKTITTSRLIPMVKDIEVMYIQQGRVIAEQKKELHFLRDKLNEYKR